MMCPGCGAPMKLDAGKDFQDVVIQPDPNFIATDEFLTFDVAIFDFRNQNPLAQDEKVQANLLKFLGQPKGLVTVHWANGAFPYWPEYINIVGRAQQSVHDPRGAFMVKIVNPNHPITREMKDYETNDELFWDTKIGNRTITPIAVATSKVHFANFPMALDETNHRLFVGCRLPSRMVVLNTDSGDVVSKIEISGDADELFYDAKHRRIYAVCGAGKIDIIEQADPNRYNVSGGVDTGDGARTGFFVPERDTLFVAVPHRGSQKAEIRAYHVE